MFESQKGKLPKVPSYYCPPEIFWGRGGPRQLEVGAMLVKHGQVVADDGDFWGSCPQRSSGSTSARCSSTARQERMDQPLQRGLWLVLTGWHRAA